MKKSIILGLALGFVSLFAFGAQEDPVVMTVNGHDVSLSEFQYLWKKNNSTEASENQSLDEYVNLFVTFKLKVEAALEAGIDTLPSYISELKGYRDQLTPPMLIDEDAIRAVMHEAYEYMRTYVELSHILIRISPDASPADTLAAYRKALEIRKLTQKKGADFAALAREYSNDASAEDGGYLGTNIGNRYIYDFAKGAMNTPKGEISQPVRTQFGYHLIKVHDRYEVPGQYLSGHILMSAPKDAPAEMKAEAERNIREIYRLLENGADFAELANTRNDDRYVVGKGGMYETLRGGSLPIEYESHIFALKDGQYSEPFQSDYGWHIVKRFTVTPFPDEMSLEEELKQNIYRDDRRFAGSRALARQLQSDYNFLVDENNFKDFEEKVLAYGKIDKGLTAATAAVSPLAHFDGGYITAGQFCQYLLKSDDVRIEYLKDSWNSFVNATMLAYENGRLEIKYPEFGHLMKEYHDGILLFEISNREVWDKAATDKEGLEAYFKGHKSDFNWEVPHYKGSVIYCSDAKLLKKVKKAAKKLPQDSMAVVLNRTFNNDSTTFVKVDRGLYAKGDKPLVDKLAFKEGDWTPSEDFPYVFLQGKVLKNPEDVADVRGQAVAAYQDYLEKVWVEGLRAKYPVTINQDVLKTLK